MDEALKQLLTLGRGSFEKKQYAQAEQFLTKVVEQNPTFADVYNMLGIIYHDQGQFARAQRAFESALRLNPAYTEAALNLAVIYNDMGKYAEAKEVYQAALSRQKGAPGELDPYVMKKVANMYADIGDVFASSGVWQKAIEEYRRALAHFPEFVDIRLKLGNALRDAGDNAAAIAEYEQVIAQNPSYIPGRINYGIALYSAGRRDEAVKVWEDVLVRSPGNKSAQMYLNLVKDPGKAEVTG
ncbi:lipopolysaccharide assembly protein LapB [Corallococcus macrosporus]|uniref:Tetratricopeptide repeat protein n=1 Tax=Corallococcus macrosporus TaxID=35 RepID=A0ABS3DJ16_9BACT|nr:tetratricopeptide repeat protein [Corallococcus macrosporus]MBN8231333.1 tetratricopeptide repeat protein [Corallococcus macrosporus]